MWLKSYFQEEQQLKSDGTSSTSLPAQMTVARITCIRGYACVMSLFCIMYIAVVICDPSFWVIKSIDLDLEGESGFMIHLRGGVSDHHTGPVFIPVSVVYWLVCIMTGCIWHVALHLHRN